MLVDAHVHVLPDRLARAVRGHFEAAVGAEALPYPIQAEGLLKALAAGGVTACWSFPYAHRAGVSEGMNRASAALAAEAAAQGWLRVVPGGTVHPEDEDPGRVAAEALDGLGLRLLKLHCSVGRFAPDDPRLASMWRLVQARRVPVVVHVGHDARGGTQAGELAAVGRVAEAYPRARVVVAHLGHPATEAALGLLEAHEALHADLTPVVTEPVAVADPARLARLAPKLMFGSDAPNTCLRAEAVAAWLDSLGLGDVALAAIRGGTAERLQAEVA